MPWDGAGLSLAGGGAQRPGAERAVKGGGAERTFPVQVVQRGLSSSGAVVGGSLGSRRGSRQRAAKAASGISTPEARQGRG
ncbi:hypothetical protein PTTG_03916 [Puccinia triticina 1-1 BBBD Race 1]|uniref:Uncharacterized protein n=1 Tax=Puccinia triticina (isolate 1-1 / race 1 (BBBD)) TaxID=630390 RepID=A0A180GI79_PUCT1|nr:hypothetical protein PTTG_03916 [Puccinia triticina 1-1 BBBD Race 1]